MNKKYLEKLLQVLICFALLSSSVGCFVRVERYERIDNGIVSEAGIVYRRLTQDEMQGWSLGNDPEEKPLGKVVKGSYLRGIIGDDERTVLKEDSRLEEGWVLYIRNDLELPDIDETLPFLMKPTDAVNLDSAKYDITNHELIEKIINITKIDIETTDISDMDCSTFYFDGFYEEISGLSISVRFLLTKDAKNLYVKGRAMQSGYAIPVEDSAVKDCIIGIIQQMRLDGVVDY